MRRVVSLFFLASGCNASAEDLLYVQPLGEYARTAEQNAEARGKLDDYARASKLAVLKDGNADQVRIWVTWGNFKVNTIGYETVGYVFSENGALSCRIKYPRTEPTPFTGSCVRLKRKGVQAPSIAEIEALANLSGLELNCGVLDGAWMEIDGVYKGRRFGLGSSNPDSCLDDGSKVVAGIMAHIWR